MKNKLITLIIQELKDKQEVMKHLCLVLSLMASLSMVSSPVYSSPCPEITLFDNTGDPEFGYVNIFTEKFRIVLEWEFSSAKKTKYFMVQRQDADQEFRNVSGINVKGENGSRQMFTMDDVIEEHGETFRYRIKAVLEDGTIHYSDMVQISIPDQADIKAYPNPVKEYVNLEYVLPYLAAYNIQLFDGMGRLIRKQSVTKPVSMTVKDRMNMMDLRPGLYYIQITVGHESFTQRVVKT